MTLLELLTSSLRAISVKNPGVTLTAEETEDAKEILNLMLDAWSADGLAVYASTYETLTLVVGDGEYTIGSAGDFNTTRPTQILNAYLRDSGSVDYSLELIGPGKYQIIPDKITSGRPTQLHYHPEYPLGKIFFDCLPDSAYGLHLDSLKTLSELTDLTATIAFPPGYEAALQSNLAVRLCPEYERQPSPVLVAEAQTTLRNIKNINAAARWEPVSPGWPHKSYVGRNTGNIISGW